MVGVYLLSAACLKKKPDLGAAINIVISTVGAVGAARLIGFIFTDQFRIIIAMGSASMWSLSAEDAVFLFVGGLALGWVSCQEVLRNFRALNRGAP